MANHFLSGRMSMYMENMLMNIYIYTVNVLISPALAFVNLPGAQPAPSCGMDPQAFVGSGSPIGAEEGGFF